MTDNKESYVRVLKSIKNKDQMIILSEFAKVLKKSDEEERLEAIDLFSYLGDNNKEKNE